MSNREQFESWMTDEQWFHGSDFEWDERRNCYSQFGIHLAYKAWQAASKASEQQLAAVVAECACCKQDIEEIAEAMETGTDLDLFLAIDGAMYIETPTTDSVLKRIQAQGVELFAERKNKEMMSLHPDTHALGSIAAAMSAEVKELREFAARLRQGAEHE